MNVHRLDPLEDPRWGRLVAKDPRASIFHTRGWLEALQRTYGYQPMAFTTSPPAADLDNGIVFCGIQSWLTGSRLVSLPFSDHCDPLVEDDQFASIASHLQAQCENADWQYIELRRSEGELREDSGYKVDEEFALHVVDLRPEPSDLFRRFHKSSTQRKILRAQREGVVCSDKQSPEVLRAFYRLLELTRRRHGVPPQPYRWFENLAACVGDAMNVRVASYRGQPVAGMVTLRHQSTLTYKYGASDHAWHRVGAVHLLFWKAIEEAHAAGCVKFDLGRTDLDDQGLLTFKERWGASRVPLHYWRFRPAGRASAPARDWVARYGARTASRVPSRLREAAGRALYRHLG